jgi:hypothetical protein
MPTFSANPQSSSAIEVSWDLADVDPGFLFDSLSITQTAPNGQQTVQNPPPAGVVQVGTTVFTELQPNTNYTYVIDATWDDGNDGVGATYNPPGISCMTKAAQPASSGSKGTGSGSSSSELALGPVTGLTAKWNAPDYKDVTVSFTAGAWATAARTHLQGLKSVGPANYTTNTTISRTATNAADTVPISFTLTNVQPDSYIIVVTETVESTSSISPNYLLEAPPPPGALSKVTATWNADYTAVILSWTQGPGTATTSMTLQRYAGAVSSSGTQPAPVKISLTPPYTDTPPSITSTSRYQYELTATNAFGQQSASSNVLSPPTAPAAPSKVVAEWSKKYSQATVTWSAVAHAESYEVVLFKTEGDGPLQSILQKVADYPNITSTTFTGPLTGQEMTEYQYQVIAHNRFGSNASAYSNGLLGSSPGQSTSTSAAASSGSTSSNPTHTLVQKSAPQQP